MKKPTVFYLGKAKKDAPPERALTKEMMEQAKRDVEKYLSQK